jgi:predicted HicB family RNase H-like nuclease
MATVSRLKHARPPTKAPLYQKTMRMDAELFAAAQEAADAAGQTMTTWVQRAMAAALGRTPPSLKRGPRQ